MTATPVTLDDIQEAFTRIKDRVRRTPLLRTRFIREAPTKNPLMVKLECLQVTGSFKPRGAMNAALQLSEAEVKRGIVTASGGNHGLGAAYAGWSLGARAVIYLPSSTPAAKSEKLRAWGAEVIIEGTVWDEANEAALARAERDGMTYIHPFADPAVIAGQGTLAVEMLKQSPDLDAIVVAIGGGGLISGVATAAKAIKPSIKIIGVEAVGAPALSQSLKAGELVTLSEVTTEAGTLAPKRSAQLNLDIIREQVDDIVLVSDDDMRRAAQWLWFEMGIGTELSGAASLAAIQAGKLKDSKVDLPEDALIATIACGSGSDGIPMVG
jgi:threonine dehydratase